MKKLFSIIGLQALLIMAIQAQTVTDYTYKLDNGITIKMERCWNHVWVQQSYSPLAENEKTPVSVNIRKMGDLISSSSFHLHNKTKEIKMQGAAPGTYDLEMNFKLSGTPGTLSFVAKDIVIKPKTKTSVSVTLYDYQVVISEIPGPLNGLSGFDSKIDRYKSTPEQNQNSGIASFFEKGKHDIAIQPAESTTKTSGKIKPGTYDMQITIEVSGQKQKVWLENFTMKPDMTYKVTTNMNAGAVLYNGGNRDIKAMHFYPAGTAATQTGAPVQVKNLEIISYENLSQAYTCSPGSYDVLLNMKNGTRFEWKKNIVVTTGAKTDIK